MVVVNVCFLTLVKSFFDTLKIRKSFGSRISDLITSKMSLGVFLHDIYYLITIQIYKKYSRKTIYIPEYQAIKQLT